MSALYAWLAHADLERHLALVIVGSLILDLRRLLLLPTLRHGLDQLVDGEVELKMLQTRVPLAADRRSPDAAPMGGVPPGVGPYGWRSARGSRLERRILMIL